MDWGFYKMPLFGQFFENPKEQQMQKTQHAAAKAYQAYRPELRDAEMNSLRQQASLFAPVNGMLGQMYGPGAQFDLGQAIQDPMSERMTQVGAPVDIKQKKKRKGLTNALGMGFLTGDPIIGGIAGAVTKIKDKKKG